MKIVVNGASELSDVPGLDQIANDVDLVFAPDVDALGAGLPDAEILLGWNFKGRDLPEQWHRADKLKWIHWCGAGVDAVMFPALVASDVLLTNARGVFDRAMAEYVLGYMISEMKLFRQNLQAQAERKWNYSVTRKVAGTKAIVFGAGSIGHEVARLLGLVGVEVCGVGRTARSGDPDFGEIYSASDATVAVSNADWIIGVMPLTPETTGIFNASIFGAMKPEARFVNIGRGQSVDEAALITALQSGQIAGAMLDVFQNEPLPGDDPIWDAPNLVISPHMSGDYQEFQADMASQFMENLDRYKAGKPLNNLINKQLGFAAS